MNFLSKVKYVFLTCLTTSYLNAQISSLDEVVNQTFCDQSAKKTMMPDGKSFAIQNNSRILQIDIATGKEIAVLFDENTVKGEKVKSVDDFVMEAAPQIWEYIKSKSTLEETDPKRVQCTIAMAKHRAQLALYNNLKKTEKGVC